MSHPATKLRGARGRVARGAERVPWDESALKMRAVSRIGTLKKMVFQELAIDLVTTARLKCSR